MFIATLPQSISQFLAALRRADLDGMRRATAEGALVIDGLASHSLESWVKQRAQQATRVISATRAQDGISLRVLVSNPNSKQRPVYERWHFSNPDNISVLTVTPETVPELPAVIDEFVRAINLSDLAALRATLADEALVNDQLCEYWNREVKQWAQSQIIDEQLRLHVVECVTNRDNVVLTAQVDGSFDTRGLPVPLLLSFYFTVHDGKIVQLIVLPKNGEK